MSLTNLKEETLTLFNDMLSELSEAAEEKRRFRYYDKSPWTEDPSVVKARKNKPVPDEAFLERRAKAIKLIWDNDELFELIAEMEDRHTEWTRNYFWWGAELLKEKGIWYCEDLSTEVIADELSEEIFMDPAEIYDTQFDIMFRRIDSSFKNGGRRTKNFTYDKTTNLTKFYSSLSHNFLW